MVGSLVATRTLKGKWQGVCQSNEADLGSRDRGGFDPSCNYELPLTAHVK